SRSQRRLGCGAGAGPEAGPRAGVSIHAGPLTRMSDAGVITASWLRALEQRHLANLTRQEFTRAVRALSARYVERRGQLPDRSLLDSAGKRAAFALFYAPLHF